MNITYQTDHDILTVEPTGPIQEDDLKELAEEIQHVTTTKSGFNGVLIRTQDYPGYEKFSDIFAHSDFIAEHTDAIPKVAICTDSALAGLLEKLGDALTEGEVERFGFDERDAAEKWLLN